MAVTTRFIGLNYGELAKTGAGQQPITIGTSTTGKDIEIALDFGDPAGSASQIATNLVAKDRNTVLAHLKAMVDFLEGWGSGNAPSGGWWNT